MVDVFDRTYELGTDPALKNIINTQGAHRRNQKNEVGSSHCDQEQEDSEEDVKTEKK